MDPRLSIIKERLKNIKRLIAISGGKGGIGKSSIASVLALILSKLGYKVGLWDLDFWGPSTHVILGINGIFPKEEKGIIPPKIYGIKFMSIIYYSGNEPSPIREIDVSNAMIELLTITRWSSLDFLIIDTPPGMGDTILDTIRLMEEVEFLIVTTQSKVVLETVKKMLSMLKELEIPILGVIENMKTTNSSFAKNQLRVFDIPFLGKIDLDEELENSMGNTNKLLKTNFAKNLEKIILATL